MKPNLSNHFFSLRKLLLFFVSAGHFNFVFGMESTLEKSESLNNYEFLSKLSRGFGGFKPDSKSAQLRELMQLHKLLGGSDEFVDKTKLKEIQDQLPKAMSGLITQMARESSPLEDKDVIIRGFLGKNWKVLEHLNPSGYDEALKYLAIFKATEVLGKHIDSTIEKSMGEMLDNTIGGTLGLIGKGFTSFYIAIRNFIKGRSGVPLNSGELFLLRDSIKQTFLELERILSKSSIIDARSREKVLRGENIESTEVDPLWLGQKVSLMKQIEFWTGILKKRSLYYDPVKDENIIFYLDQIRAALEDINKNFIIPSKSQREFGSSSNQQALQVRRSMIDINFINLIKYISPKSSDEKSGYKENPITSSLIRAGRRENEIL